MTIADEARDNALHCEMVKYAYRQTRDGVVVSFVVHPNDIPASLSTSHIGARYMVALVEIGDDEKPVRVAGAATPATGRSMARDGERSQGTKGGRHALTPNDSSLIKEASQDEPAPGKPRRDWRELQPAQQAGIRCEEPTFAAFLKETRSDDWHESQDAAACVRLICGVHSRVELGTNQKARIIWTQLDSAYQAWLAMERVS